MRLYKRMTIISGVLLIGSFVIAVILNSTSDESFLKEICLAIFGGAFLSTITSVMGYYSEKRKSMEYFFEETLRYLNEINKYQHDLSLEQKIEFFLNLSDYNLINWDMQFGQFDFWNNKHRQYIYLKIYTPINKLNKAIAKHSWHFRMHYNGTGRNDIVMEEFLTEVEAFILDVKLANFDGVSMLSGTEYIHNSLYENVTNELMGRYSGIMRGWC